MFKWRVGIYVRWSVDDGMSKELNSIINQKNFIKNRNGDLYVWIWNISA